MPDMQWESVAFALSEVQHKYGENVHILSDPFQLSRLARLCRKGTVQPEVNRLVAVLYQDLLHAVVAREFPRRNESIPTRMIDSTERGAYVGEIIDPDTRAVTVNIARAGALPSQVCFDALNAYLDPDGVRQDHFIVARTVDAEEHVTGASIGASKIGGPVDGMFVLLPDPMGATGSSLCAAVRSYREDVGGDPLAFVALHLIVTPEYLKRITGEHPDLIVYALRLDRGMSDEAVLRTVPGTFWDRERGLDEKGYIVPGAGGLGEVLNNSWV